MLMGKKFILYFDILGFRELVKKGNADTVYNTVNNTLQKIHEWGGARWFDPDEGKSDYSIVYFSDTIILSRKDMDYNIETLEQVTTLSSIIFSALLADRIPIRGVISYNDFTNKVDSLNKHDIFFGNALIEAYDSEKKENWLGVTVCASALKSSAEIANDIYSEKYGNKWFIRKDETTGDIDLLIKPFQSIIDARSGKLNIQFYNYSMVELNDLKALSFIIEKENYYIKNCDFSSRIASKYYSTIACAKKVLGDECFEWAIKEIDRLKADGII
jgi:hypothetical protein